jgi:hypothetical protein
MSNEEEIDNELLRKLQEKIDKKIEEEQRRKLQGAERVRSNEGTYELNPYDEETKVMVKIEDVQRRSYWKLICKGCRRYGKVKLEQIVEQKQRENRKYFDYKRLCEIKNTHQYQETSGEHTEFEEIEGHDIVKEVRIRNRTHVIVYDVDSLRVEEVDGFEIQSDKCAYICRECGAIFNSKNIYCRSLFHTNDPQCKECIHIYRRNKDERMDVNIRNLDKICECERWV